MLQAVGPTNPLLISVAAHVAGRHRPSVARATGPVASTATPPPHRALQCRVMPGPTAPVELLTSSEAEIRQRRAAGALRRAGLVAGDRVLLAVGSSAALLCAVLGATRVGIVPVLVNPSLLPNERDLLAADAEPTMVVADPAALAALDQGPEVELAPHPVVRPMHYTSGTTGRSKGVVAGPWDAATAAAVFADEADLWSFGPGDLHLVCTPMHHTVSIRFAATTLLSGGSCMVLGHFDAARVLEVLRAAHPTTTFMVPTHLRRLLATAELGGAERFGSLRLLVHAGEPCPPALKQATMARLAPGVMWEFYGSTEGQFTVCSPEEWQEHPGTVGRARPGRRLRTDAEPGAIGTIWCEAPAFARFRYWRDAEATTQAWSGDAFSVGDLGHLDASGYLYLSGRRHDLIISGGVNVYPAEVEAVLSDVPGVAELAVFPVEDTHWGQRVCAAVVPSPGADHVVDALGSLARARLAPYKRPKEYVVVADLPRTATGKLRRGDVAAHLGLG